MEKDNRIKGVAYAVTIDSGTYAERSIESLAELQLNTTAAKFSAQQVIQEVTLTTD